MNPRYAIINNQDIFIGEADSPDMYTDGIALGCSIIELDENDFELLLSKSATKRFQWDGNSFVDSTIFEDLKHYKTLELLEHYSSLKVVKINNYDFDLSSQQERVNLFTKCNLLTNYSGTISINNITKATVLPSELLPALMIIEEYYTILENVFNNKMSQISKANDDGKLKPINIANGWPSLVSITLVNFEITTQNVE